MSSIKPKSNKSTAVQYFRSFDPLWSVNKTYKFIVGIVILGRILKVRVSLGRSRNE